MSRAGITTVELEAFEVAGLRVNAVWNELHTKVPQAWRELMGAVASDDGYLEVSVEVVDGVYTELVGLKRAELAQLPAGFEILRVPANRWLHIEHLGSLREIADSFGALYEHARLHGIAVGDLKLDMGYTRSGTEQRHDLYLAIAPVAQPQWID